MDLGGSHRCRVFQRALMGEGTTEEQRVTEIVCEGYQRRAQKRLGGRRRSRIIEDLRREAKGTITIILALT